MSKENFERNSKSLKNYFIKIEIGKKKKHGLNGLMNLSYHLSCTQCAARLAASQDINKFC